MRAAAVTKRVLRQLRRDHRTVGLILAAPVVVLTLIWAVFASDDYRPRLAVVDQHEHLRSRLEEEGARLTEVEDVDIARAALERREFDAVVWMDDNGPALIMEGSDPTVTAAVRRAFAGAMAALLSDTVSGETEMEYLFGDADMTLFDGVGPPIIGIIVFFLVFVVSGISFVRERTTGTLERMLATPLRRSEVVLGYAVAFLLVATAQSLLVSLVAVYLLDLLLVGELVNLIIVVLFLATTSVSLAMFLSAFATNEFQMFQFIPVVILPQVFFSGLFNLQAMHPWLQGLGLVMPLTHGSIAMREVMLRGSGLGTIWPHLLVLLGFTVIMLALNVVALKKYRRL